MAQETRTNTSLNPLITIPLTEIGSEYDQVVDYPDGDVQTRLAEITEMIHVASLLHDDVIDGSPNRRGAPSVNSSVGNKMVYSTCHP